jgi:Interferon-induced transmembrane protein/GYF domain 2
MSQFYYTDGKERFGPFTLEQLREKNITAGTLVWKEGLPDWVPARNLSDLESLFPLDSISPPPLAVPYGTPVVEAPPKNWLIESILVTILCCLPLGIVGIIYATKVDTLWSTGQREAAYKASQEAGKWVKIGAIAGFAAIIIYALLMIFGVIASLGLGTGLEV